MANGIASADLVIAISKACLLGSFGSAGLVPSHIQVAWIKFKVRYLLRPMP
ncbi:MAG: hypothetical protein WAT22_09795 [Saprospiraceae bacterium]|nr:hypothetical protein [Saprospiraceae bacterium]MBK9567253.1 hypothetical protein [Saprospiraceae bacterium]